MKRCPTCKEIKDASEFGRNVKRADGLSCYCRQCSKDRDKIRRVGKPKLSVTENRIANLRHNYGITVDDYNKMLNDQAGRCAICGMFPLFQKLCIDHCHESGKVRGLLCNKCNIGLGNFRDEPDLLEAAVRYLLK